MDILVFHKKAIELLSRGGASLMRIVALVVLFFCSGLVFSSPRGFLHSFSEVELLELSQAYHKQLETKLPMPFDFKVKVFGIALEAEKLENYMRGDTKSVNILRKLQNNHSIPVPEFLSSPDLNLKKFKKNILKIIKSSEYNKLFHLYARIYSDLSDRSVDPMPITGSIFFLYWVSPKLVESGHISLAKELQKKTSDPKTTIMKALNLRFQNPVIRDLE
jgi:hypothetical protein